MNQLTHVPQVLYMMRMDKVGLRLPLATVLLFLPNLDDESCDITMSQDVPNRRTSLRHKSPKCKAKKKTVNWDDNIVNVTQINLPSTSQSTPGGPANPDAAPPALTFFIRRRTEKSCESYGNRQL